MFYKSIKGRAGQFLGNYKQQNPATFAAAQQAVGGLLILDGLVGIDNPLGGKKEVVSLARCLALSLVLLWFLESASSVTFLVSVK